jgi:hypothetical protein
MVTIDRFNDFFVSRPDLSGMTRPARNDRECGSPTARADNRNSFH